MKNIKLVALNIDGILLEDTFSPIIHSFVSKFGIEYTRELERNVFSRPQKEAAEYLAKAIGKDSETILKNYFEDRDQYLKIHGCNVNEGVPELLELLITLEVRLIYYGGLKEEKVIDYFKEYKHFFERYICTNDFRPGIKEITKDIYGLDYNQVLFIDDVNTVAEVAKKYNVPFIGIPSNFPWGFQRHDMITTKVKYLLNSVKEIDIGLLEKIDCEVSVGAIWKRKKHKRKDMTKNCIQKPETIFVDFDGVISKGSVLSNIKNTHRFINQYTPIPFEALLGFFRSTMCFSMKQTINYLLTSLGIEDKLPKLYEEQEDIYDNTRIKIEDDFFLFLDFCDRNSIRYMIYSSRDNDVKKVSQLANKINNNSIFNLNGRSKANYCTYLEVAKELELNLKKCMYIDDTPLALRTGKLHGMTTVMMLNEVFTLENYQIFSSYVDYKINSFSELLQILSVCV